MSDFDFRKHPDYTRALGRIQGVRLRPLVGPGDLDEVATISEALPALAFPINSAGELLDQIGDGTRLPVLGMDVDPVRMIKYMPAYYFPIASQENLVEKMAELIRINRRQVDSPKYTAKMREKFRRARFPIRTPQELERALVNTPEFNIDGRRIETRSAIAELPPDTFPIRDQRDLEAKAIRFLQSRPLIEKD